MDITQVIANQEQALLSAIRQQDLDQLDLLLHQDLLFTLPTGQTITKADDMASYRAGYMAIKSLQASQQQIHLIGAAAVVAVTITLEGTYQGQPLTGTYRYLRVWQQNQDVWQVIAGSCVAIAN
ncbi:MAG: nuclear transport factor 2 family protein [Janthinobacterium lividum]